MFHMNQNLKMGWRLSRSIYARVLTDCMQLRVASSVKFPKKGRCLFSQTARKPGSRCCVLMGRGEEKMSLKPEALALLMDGVDLRGAQMRPWYHR